MKNLRAPAFVRFLQVDLQKKKWHYTTKKRISLPSSTNVPETIVYKGISEGGRGFLSSTHLPPFAKGDDQDFTGTKVGL